MAWGGIHLLGPYLNTIHSDPNKDIDKTEIFFSLTALAQPAQIRVSVAAHKPSVISFMTAPTSTKGLPGTNRH